jgi:hypothetical protein
VDFKLCVSIVFPSSFVSLFTGKPGRSSSARNFLTRPPSDCFAIDFPGRAINPCEDLTPPHTSLKRSSRGCPFLRASNEHSFSVRVMRARRSPGYSFSSSRLRCSPVGSRLREKSGASHHPFVTSNGPSKLARYFSPMDWHPCWSHCGRRTSTFRSCAFREHRTNMGGSPRSSEARMINVNPFGGGNPFSPNSVTNPFSPTVWR